MLNSNPEPTKRVWGRLPENYAEELQRKADRLGMSFSGYISMCIRIGDSAFSSGQIPLLKEEDLPNRR